MPYRNFVVFFDERSDYALRMDNFSITLKGCLSKLIQTEPNAFIGSMCANFGDTRLKARIQGMFLRASSDVARVDNALDISVQARSVVLEQQASWEDQNALRPGNCDS